LEDASDLFLRAFEPQVEELVLGISALAPDDASQIEQAFKNALVDAIGEIWEVIAAAHASLDALEPLALQMQEAGHPLDPNLIDAVGRVIGESNRPLKGAFLARALNAVARLSTQLDDVALGRAAGAASDYAVLVDALAQPEAISDIGEDEPFERARLRGLRIRERMLRERGGTLTVEQAAQLLAITRQGVDKRRRSGRLLALSTGRRGYAYPAWQFRSGSVLPGFERVLKELAVQDPWMQAGFFLSTAASLDGVTPLEALERGDIDGVCRAARAYGEQTPE
jgi:hypothetical protein